MFAFGADVALEGIHLDLNAFVFALCLRRLATVHEQNGDGDEDEEDTTGRDSTNGFGRERVRLHHFVLQVSDGETHVLADADDDQR